MTLANGTSLGRHEIRSLIGVGGLGEVYLANDPKIGLEAPFTVVLNWTSTLKK